MKYILLIEALINRQEWKVIIDKDGEYHFEIVKNPDEKIPVIVTHNDEIFVIKNIPKEKHKEVRKAFKDKVRKAGKTKIIEPRKQIGKSLSHRLEDNLLSYVDRQLEKIGGPIKDAPGYGLSGSYDSASEDIQNDTDSIIRDLSKLPEKERNNKILKDYIANILQIVKGKPYNYKSLINNLYNKLLIYPLLFKGIPNNDIDKRLKVAERVFWTALKSFIKRQMSVVKS